jgi:DNA-binding beta-propeller fold protein YncE
MGTGSLRLGLLAGLFAAASSFAQEGETAGPFHIAEERTITFPRLLTRPSVTEQAIWVGQGGRVPIWEKPLHAVCRVDPQTGQVTASIPLSYQPLALAVGGGAVWVQQDNAKGSLVRIDEKTLEPAPVPGVGWSDSFPVLAFGEGSVWIVEHDIARAGSVILFGRSFAIVRIDARTGQVLARIPVSGANGIAVGAGAVWVMKSGAGFDKSSTVWRIDPATNQIVATIPVPKSIDDIAFGEGFVWVVRNQIAVVGSDGDSEVNRVDPATNQVVGEPIRVPSGFCNLAVGNGTVWVLSANGSLVRIDPQTGRQLGQPTPIFHPMKIAAGPTGVWITRWSRPMGTGGCLLTPLVP